MTAAICFRDRSAVMLLKEKLFTKTGS